MTTDLTKFDWWWLHNSGAYVGSTSDLEDPRDTIKCPIAMTGVNLRALCKKAYEAGKDEPEDNKVT